MTIIARERNAVFTPFKELKVLLVEDDPVTRWLLRLALKGSCLLATAPDIERAVIVSESYQPDIVLLGMGLPGEASSELRERLARLGHGLRIITYNAQSTAEAVAESFKGDLHALLTRPKGFEEALA